MDRPYFKLKAFLYTFIIKIYVSTLVNQSASKSFLF